MLPNLDLRKLLRRVLSSVPLFLNALLLRLRSRRGFNNMLMTFRGLGLLVILGRFVLAGTPDSFLKSPVWVLYLGLCLIVTALFNGHESRLDEIGGHWILVTADTVLINFYIWLGGNAYSELYLLFLIPLAAVAQFLDRRSATLASGAMMTVYGLTLYRMAPGSPDAAFLMLWGGRCVFLLGATWLYRIQRSLPNPNDTTIISPSRARLRLEDLLRQLARVVRYDTISVQILYGGQLQIVACLGFENPDDIYRIEFPADDDRYPNRQVIQARKPFIANARDFPSFQESRYFAGHIQTWLGVPLISPSTSECFGLLSVDSSLPNAFSRKDAARAGWFASEASRFLIEAPLGPAALTQATKRANLQKSLKSWAVLAPERHSLERRRTRKPSGDQDASGAARAGGSLEVFRAEEELDIVRELALLGQGIFHVEDCSIFFLRGRSVDGVYEKVLHLVASSAIPPEVFDQHEIRVTGSRGDGLTGLAVHRDLSLNYSAAEIARSPYHGTFTGHLSYLFSRRSKQIMIVPLHNLTGKEQGPVAVTGAIKVENRLGRNDENRFLGVEYNLFKIYGVMVSLILENIRQRNYIARQQQSIHNLRAVIHPTAAIPLLDLLGANDVPLPEAGREKLKNVLNSVEYTKLVLSNVLADSTENLFLEREGLFSAIRQYIETLKKMPNFKPACELISVDFHGVRDILPYRVRVSFYNIVREAIINMVRHSQIASREFGCCSITTNLVENTVHLAIEDNGVGFCVSEVRQRQSCFGLRDMDDQVNAIRQAGFDAGIEIEAAPDGGTRIHAWAALR